MSAPPQRPPSVDALARSLRASGLPHPLLVEVAQQAIAAGDWDGAEARATALARSLLQPVVNATGVMLHTNLGRAPLRPVEVPPSSNLELDLATGRRGSRQSHVGALIARACGAEAAIVVNNNAAAVLLVLATLAPGREVLVSRAESVEIGGGFRVPEVIAQSGASLRDVGTTNRTRVADYEAAIGPDTALLLKVHASNYRIEGFVETTPIGDLAALGPPLVADIGSGLLDAACPWLPDGPPHWLAGEPAARQTLAAGAALVTFSGDKLLGGPQAGIIAGRSDLVDACARHPLSRALRPGSLVLAALQHTVLAYLRRDVATTIPFWAMATAPLDELRRRADKLVATAGTGRVEAMASVPGAGSLPGASIPSWGVAVDGDHADELRRNDPAIIARARDGRTWLDLRTVAPGDDELVAAALGRVVRER